MLVLCLMCFCCFLLKDFRRGPNLDVFHSGLLLIIFRHIDLVRNNTNKENVSQFFFFIREGWLQSFFMDFVSVLFFVVR